jgi:hypothetical protein
VDPVWRQLAFLFSPAGSYFLAFDKGYQGAAGVFWGSVLATHLFAWLCLALSAIVLPQAFLEKPSAEKQNAPTPWVRSKFRDGIRQRSLRREDLERNPMAWLADRDRPRRRWVWCFPSLTIWLWMGFKLDPLGNTAAQAGFVAFVAIHVARPSSRRWVAFCFCPGSISHLERPSSMRVRLVKWRCCGCF